MGDGKWEVGEGKGPGLAVHTRRPSLPSSFQNGSQGDFPTGGRAEPLKRNRIWLRPLLEPLEGETQVNHSRVRSRRTSKWQRGLCDPGLFPAPGYLAPSALSTLLAQKVPRDSAPNPAKWECPAGKVSAARSDRGTHAATSAVPCAPPQLQGGAPHPLPGLHRAGRQISRALRAYLGGRHASAGVLAALGPSFRLPWTGDPGDSLPVPAEVGVAFRTGGVRAWPASPTPSRRGSCGSSQPIGWADQGLPGRA